MYPAGHSIVVTDAEHRSQRFVPCTPEASRITAIAVSPNLKHLAVAESYPVASGTPSTITVYELATLKRRKVLPAGEQHAGDILDVDFSQDGRFLLAQGGAPDWMLTLWVWEKAKVGCTLRTGVPGGAVLSVRFCPNDQNHVSALGSNFVKVLRASEGSLKPGPPPLAKRDAQEYTCQAWVNDGDRDKLAVGCASGEILLIEGVELKSVLHTEGNAPVDTLCAWSKGLLAGQANGGLATFERDEQNTYRRTKVFKLRNTARITALALGQHETQLALATDNRQLLTLPIGNVEILKPENDCFEQLCGALRTSTLCCVTA